MEKPLASNYACKNKKNTIGQYYHYHNYHLSIS
jgi:hypothetical protein